MEEEEKKEMLNLKNNSSDQENESHSGAVV